jgi:hypothetical protein
MIKETVFFRSDGYGIIKLLFGSIAHNFTDRHRGGGADEEVIVHEDAKVFEHFGPSGICLQLGHEGCHCFQKHQRCRN